MTDGDRQSNTMESKEQRLRLRELSELPVSVSFIYAGLAWRVRTAGHDLLEVEEALSASGPLTAPEIHDLIEAVGEDRFRRVTEEALRQCLGLSKTTTGRSGSNTG